VVAAAISGRVTGASGEPLVCATVRLASDAPVPQVFTDRQGRYAIDGLPAGSYLVEARQNGYLTLHHGQRQPADAQTVITLREGERRTGADVVLPRESFVTGTVVDEHGEPMEGILVWAFQLRRLDGRLSTMLATTVPRPTDDRGQYRIAGLSPGTYLVATMSRGGVATAGGARGYASIYYPGTADAATALRIVIVAGRDATGIDVSFTPTPTATVFGSAVDAAGRPLAGRVGLFASGRSGAVSVESWSATPDGAGAFVFRNVPRGDYVVKAAGPDGAHQFGMQYVTVVDGDPPPVRVIASAGATLEGRVVIEGPPDINVTGLTVAIAPADFDHGPIQGPGPVTMFAREEDGSFRAFGAFGPSRIVVGATPACEGCYLKSVYVNGMDAADRPFDFGVKGGVYRDVEIVVSDAGAAIEGRATDDQGGAVPLYSVVAVPVDPELWYSRSRHLKITRSGPGGDYRVTGLPPGDYVVSAVNRLQFGSVEMIDPDLLDQIVAGGRRVRVAERERRTLDLRLIRR
jgi:hypothetical protein